MSDQMRQPLALLKKIVESQDQEGEWITPGGNRTVWKKSFPDGASGVVVDFEINPGD